MLRSYQQDLVLPFNASGKAALDSDDHSITAHRKWEIEIEMGWSTKTIQLHPASGRSGQTNGQTEVLVSPVKSTEMVHFPYINCSFCYDK
jgi:hypothetical protein